ncbi:MAG: hypothetical protein GY884_11860 [Proteobacteria bacterium]|nr:hypothetical protein [Pseudomonadota bacterium]
MRCFLMVAGLSALTACTAGGPVEEEDLPATLVVNYAWSGFENMPEETCAAAWADTLYVEMDHPDGDYNLRQAACDNLPIEIPGLSTGVWTVEVRTTQYADTAPASYGVSELVDVTLGSDSTVEIDVTLECVENSYSCDRTE